MINQADPCRKEEEEGGESSVVISQKRECQRWEGGGGGGPGSPPSLLCLSYPALSSGSKWRACPPNGVQKTHQGQEVLAHRTLYDDFMLHFAAQEARIKSGKGRTHRGVRSVVKVDESARK